MGDQVLLTRRWCSRCERGVLARVDWAQSVQGWWGWRGLRVVVGPLRCGWVGELVSPVNATQSSVTSGWVWSGNCLPGTLQAWSPSYAREPGTTASPATRPMTANAGGWPLVGYRGA
jgi:hypothetical protein